MAVAVIRLSPAQIKGDAIRQFVLQFDEAIGDVFVAWITKQWRDKKKFDVCDSGGTKPNIANQDSISSKIITCDLCHLALQDHL